MITIRLLSGSVQKQLEALAQRIEHPREVLSAAASAGFKMLRRHFSEKDSIGNKLGGRRTHFWGDVYKSTQVGTITDREATIAIGDSRFAQRLYGGTITAKTPWKGSGIKLLTIPVHPQAHGRRVSTLAGVLGIKLTFRGSAKGGVIGSFAKEAQKKEVYYACVPSVVQQPDPTALPDMSGFEKAVAEAAQENLNLQVGNIQSQS